MKFEEFNISKQLYTAIKKLGYEAPTHIQESSIPYILEGKDLMGESATGSGKTLAFACGIIEKIMPGQGIQALVLTPTRELAQQVRDSIKDLSKSIKVVPIYGGVAIGPQFDKLARADVVVATPGRFLDHMQRRTVDTSKIKILVMDEADRMFDMGFIDDVEKIIRVCPKKRQTLFFSATLSSRVKNLANRYMNKPLLVKAERMVDPTKLKQVYYNVNRNQKISLLVHLLKHEDAGLVMVFCNTRNSTDYVAKNLHANKINAVAIHGGYTQNKRSGSLDSFNNAKAGVLVCTDVAARGLDIANVSHIYNYEIPKDPVDYVHRIGRTARAGEKGKVVNLLCDLDHQSFGRIETEYRSFSIQKIERPQLEHVVIVRNSPQRRSPSFHRRR